MLIFLLSQTYILNSKSKILFYVNASFHKVEGRAEKIISEIDYDSVKISGYVRVFSNSLKTDNSIRDAQIYKSINANKYPFIEFIPDSLKDNIIYGKFKLSGIEKYIYVPLNLKFEGNFAYVNGNFKILLSDFNIKRPKFGLLEVSDTINIVFDLIYERK